jgi:hypothetical protein
MRFFAQLSSSSGDSSSSAASCARQPVGEKAELI